MKVLAAMSGGVDSAVAAFQGWSGTAICAPVSRVAGFVPPVERSPCRPGSVWVTSRTTEAGSST